MSQSSNGGHVIAVGLSGPSPRMIDEAHTTWLPESVPQLFVGDTDDTARSLWHVERQDELARQWSYDHNHWADNRPLRLVQLANRTLWGRFGFLALGDLDTCFDLEHLRSSLAHVDPDKRLYLGLPFSEEYSYPLKGGLPECAHSPEGGCCRLQSHECRPRVRECAGQALIRGCASPGSGYRRAPAWGMGGAGIVLSRGLLKSMDERVWLRCYKRMVKYGSDVRVSSCIYTLTGASDLNPNPIHHTDHRKPRTRRSP